MEVRLLQRYRIDRADGATALGPEKLVILVLKCHDTPEISVAISKVDAMMISIQLADAAKDVQSG